MTIYKIKFVKSAKKEWDSLSPNIRTLFTKQLKKRMGNPHIIKAKLSGSLKNHYKIKLQSAGYRLVYRVEDKELKIVVVGIGKRNNIYEKLKKRI